MKDLVVFLIIVCVTVVITGPVVCPGMCTCQHSQQNITKLFSLKCNYTKDIGKIIPKNTQSLTLKYLNDRQFTEIFESLQKSSLPQLNYLIITYSNLSKGLSMINLTNCRELDLTNNKIKNFNLTLNITDLKRLNLSNNKIKHFEYHSIKTTLELLNLSANSLIIVNFNFSGLQLLKYLDLSSNNLTEINDENFSELSSLLYLNLSKNKIKRLTGVCFRKLLKLQQLDVSWNNLKQVSLSIQLPSLMRLNLEGNQELGQNSREPTLLVGTGTKLKLVDASKTGLKQVPTALTQSIRTLRLSGNTIQTVQCGDLDSYPLLQLLDFASNNLELIEYDALGRIEPLSILYINNNSLKDIPKSLPEKLKVLHAQRNKINKINNTDLQGLHNLEILLISDNEIEIIEAGAFNHVTSLVTLDISRNPIKFLNVGCFSGPEALQVLRLSGINIDLPNNVLLFPLSTPEHLIILDLSNSPLLAHKLLEDTATLAASRELQELNLSHTNLEEIRYDLLYYLTQLRILNIKGNKLNCTDLQWLATWMRKQDDLEYQQVTCSNPPELWGTLLVDLPDQELISNENNINESLRNGKDKEPYKHNSTAINKLENESEYQHTFIYKNSTDDTFDSNSNVKSSTNNNLEITTLQTLSTDNKEKLSAKTKNIIMQTTKYSTVETKELFQAKTNINNVTTGKMSLLTSKKNESLLQPGMFLFCAILLTIAGIVSMLTKRFNKNGRIILPTQDVLESGNANSITELW